MGSYIHAGNKIATLVGLSKNVEGAQERENVAMQAAAMNSIALNEEGVDQSTTTRKSRLPKTS